MNVYDAAQKACQEPTLVDALSWIAVWECERAIAQAKANTGKPLADCHTHSGGEWDTCFKRCFEVVMALWGGEQPRSKPRYEAPTITKRNPTLLESEAARASEQFRDEDHTGAIRSLITAVEMAAHHIEALRALVAGEPATRWTGAPSSRVQCKGCLRETAVGVDTTGFCMACRVIQDAGKEYTRDKEKVEAVQIPVPPGFQACAFAQATASTGNKSGWRLGMCAGCDEHEPGELDVFDEDPSDQTITWLRPAAPDPEQIADAIWKETDPALRAKQIDIVRGALAAIKPTDFDRALAAGVEARKGLRKVSRAPLVKEGPRSYVPEDDTEKDERINLCSVHGGKSDRFSQGCRECEAEKARVATLGLVKIIREAASTGAHVPFGTKKGGPEVDLEDE